MIDNVSAVRISCTVDGIDKMLPFINNLRIRGTVLCQ